MRIIIVITAPPPEYKLWALSEEWDLDPKFAPTPVRVAVVNLDRILVLCQAKTNKTSDYDALMDIRSVTTPWVYHLANSDEYSSAEKVYVAAHQPYVDLAELPLKINDDRYAAGAFFHHEIREDSSWLFADLIELLQRQTQDTFETALETIVRNQVLSRRQRLATLKYHLAHVFLPVTVDLHAWREVDFDEDYMNEILNSAVGSEERLDRARSLVYEQAVYPGVDTVEKLVKEAEIESDSSWNSIQELLPRRGPRFYQTRDVPPFSILESLDDREKLKALKTRLLENDQTFAEWTNKLESALTELASEMK